MWGVGVVVGLARETTGQEGRVTAYSRVGGGLYGTESVSGRTVSKQGMSRTRHSSNDGPDNAYHDNDEN